MGIESSGMLGRSMDEPSPGGLSGLLRVSCEDVDRKVRVAMARRIADAHRRGGQATRALCTGRARPEASRVWSRQGWMPIMTS